MADLLSDRASRGEKAWHERNPHFCYNSVSAFPLISSVIHVTPAGDKSHEFSKMKQMIQ